MQRLFSRVVVTGVALALVLMAVSSVALAQSYHRSNLVSNLTGKAKHTDALLNDRWGRGYGTGLRLWVRDGGW